MNCEWVGEVIEDLVGFCMTHGLSRTAEALIEAQENFQWDLAKELAEAQASVEAARMLDRICQETGRSR